MTSTDRRQFLTTAAAVAAATPFAGGFGVGREDTLNLALVGCGGRGKGSIGDTMAVNDSVRLVAISDVNEGKVQAAKANLEKSHGDKVQIANEQAHVGLDGYQAILNNPSVDVVHFTTSPGFRPRHVLEAVQAGKHVFAEKPVCVDPAGWRICKEARARQEKWDRHCDRHPIPASEELRGSGRNDQARCDWHREGNDRTVLLHRNLEPRASRRHDGCRVPNQQLDALHLVVGRSDLRAGRPQC